MPAVCHRWQFVLGWEEFVFALTRSVSAVPTNNACSAGWKSYCPNPLGIVTTP